MKTLNMKLALSAVAVAMLATPALAARSHQHVVQQPSYSTNQTGEYFTYPNGAPKTGTQESYESGAEFNLLAHPIN
jgi:hypothetical protein